MIDNVHGLCFRIDLVTLETYSMTRTIEYQKIFSPFHPYIRSWLSSYLHTCCFIYELVHIIAMFISSSTTSLLSKWFSAIDLPSAFRSKCCFIPDAVDLFNHMHWIYFQAVRRTWPLFSKVRVFVRLGVKSFPRHIAAFCKLDPREMFQWKGKT